MASANAYIIQFGPPDPTELLEIQAVFDKDNSVNSVQLEYEQSNEFTQYTVYPAQNPMPRAEGHTSTPNDWSDSPLNSPELLNRHRYSYGRETFGEDRYGTLDSSYGQLITQRSFSNADGMELVQKGWDASGSLVQKDMTPRESVLAVQNIYVSSDTDIEQFAFLLVARPIPYSIKNPVDSDVFIRLANHGVYPLASGTVNLKIDGVLQQDLLIEPFFTGNGGLNVTWANTVEFNYGAQVDIQWTFEDTAIPPNEMIIEYWFRVVEDKAAPRILNQNPEDDETGIVVSSSILFDVVDYETGVDITSLELYVNNIYIERDDTNLTIVEIDNGYRLQYQSPEAFLYGDVIPVVVRIRDSSTHENESFFIWSFTTEGSIPPILINQDPAPCQTNVERIKNISFEVIDGGHGVQRDSIKMGVNNMTMDDVLIVPVVRRQD